MKIKNHLLYDDNNKQVIFKPTPNKGGIFTPRYLIMHYTAAIGSAGSIEWFLTRKSEVSAHLIIDRDGTITQFAPFNVICWHAGISTWNGEGNLNSKTIGIELVNAGVLAKRPTGGGWVSKNGNRPVQDAEVIVAKHRNGGAEEGWQTYTEYQLKVAFEVSSALMQTYGMKEFLGHEDIAPGRKSDPGPAFPMSNFKARLEGRREERPVIHITTAPVNIRKGAGTDFGTLTNAPLPKGTKTQVIKREGNWSFVEVEDIVEGLNDIEGWINSKFLVTK